METRQTVPEGYPLYIQLRICLAEDVTFIPRLEDPAARLDKVAVVEVCRPASSADANDVIDTNSPEVL